MRAIRAACQLEAAIARGAGSCSASMKTCIESLWHADLAQDVANFVDHHGSISSSGHRLLPS
jgi:hypothetical protein